MIIRNINEEKIRTQWLSWYNTLRKERGLTPLVYNASLNRTASLWSAEAAKLGKITHTRKGSNGTYYDYQAIKQWFIDRGLSFKNVKKITFTENIGSGPYSCKEKECTDRVLKSIRQTFDFYVGEEKKSYRPHWNSMVNPEFKQVGLGIVVRNGKYFLTMHFGTEVLSNEKDVCIASASVKS